jgi:hypothetical protein
VISFVYYLIVEEVPDIGELMLASFPTTRAQYNSIATDTISWYAHPPFSLPGH